jgi:hypothetical protein
VLDWLTDASADSSVSILLAPNLRELMSEVAQRNAFCSD